MAGLLRDLRPTSTSSVSSLNSHLIGLFTFLLLSLALLAFFLRVPDPLTRFTNCKGEPVQSPSVINHAGRILGRSPTPSFPYYRDWKFNFGSDLSPKICITSTTSGGLEEILPWIFYHKVIGVSNFFLFVEGKAASLAAYKVLKSIPGVKPIHRTRDLEVEQSNSRIWNETWLSSFFYKPCNYELFVKQTLNMETGIAMATEAGMDWIIHLDTDELIYPAGNRDYSVQKLLSDVPEDVDLLIFLNYESVVERDDVKEPFSEFRRVFCEVSGGVYGEVSGDFGSVSSMFPVCWSRLLTPTAVAGGFFVLWECSERFRSGLLLFLLSISLVTVLIASMGLLVRFRLLLLCFRMRLSVHWLNLSWFWFVGVDLEITFEEAAVLHYTYSKFSDLTSRRNRCGCKLTREDIERCFMLEFDRTAFVIASTGTEEEMLHWYRKHVVWNDMEVNSKLLKEGILTRIYTPTALLLSLKESGIFTSVIESTEATISDDNTMRGPKD
ncbi:hypothetical protein BUALT_Bualt12G0024700 [Buddleja alternifolia]|uniref:Glycosyltransferase family 92 protein n=1 Tax=Buddleja alternifolia TaxID=168488 RepID=A0AAV6WW66_9LAMI|nr:hypothetical protein BUALT_Bualt12G0024700 [Buddleja alternifolia]